MHRKSLQPMGNLILKWTLISLIDQRVQLVRMTVIILKILRKMATSSMSFPTFLNRTQFRSVNNNNKTFLDLSFLNNRSNIIRMPSRTGVVKAINSKLFSKCSRLTCPRTTVTRQRTSSSQSLLTPSLQPTRPKTLLVWCSQHIRKTAWPTTSRCAAKWVRTLWALKEATAPTEGRSRVCSKRAQIWAMFRTLTSTSTCTSSNRAWTLQVGPSTTVEARGSTLSWSVRSLSTTSWLRRTYRTE